MTLGWLELFERKAKADKELNGVGEDGGLAHPRTSAASS
jgi:hypothetical protein